MEDTDLRRALIDYRETFIWANAPFDVDARKASILRRSMIDQLIACKPQTVAEWRALIPPYHWRRTNQIEFEQHAYSVVAILNRHWSRAIVLRRNG